MPVNWTTNVTRVSLLACAMSLTACAATSPPLPVAPPTIPRPPVASEPPASGSFWAKHCELLKSVQAVVKQSAPTSEQCSGLGL